MPVAGRKPKPEDQRRNRVKSPFEWREVPNVPFANPPDLPPYPGRPRSRTAPDPPRPLGTAGEGLWRTVWRSGGTELLDPSVLAVLCEQMDERVALRLAVLRDGHPEDRSALRQLDKQMANTLSVLNPKSRSPLTWPPATRRWWKAVSTMPHCALWDEAEWQFAIDTASLVAALHAGDLRVAAEVRAREAIIGTTADARRDLRIKYVSPDSGDVEEEASVTAMAEYRRLLQ